jgi:hypothetical protein
MSYSSSRRVRNKFGQRIRPYVIAGIATVGVVGIALSVYQRIGEFDSYLDRKSLRDSMVGQTVAEVLNAKRTDIPTHDSVSSTGDSAAMPERRDLFAVAKIPHDSETYGAIAVGSEAFRENAPVIAGALDLLGDSAYGGSMNGPSSAGGAGFGGGQKVALADLTGPNSGGSFGGAPSASGPGGSGGQGGSPQTGGTSNPGGGSTGGSAPTQTASLPTGGGESPANEETEQPENTSNNGGGSGGSGGSGDPDTQTPSANNSPSGNSSGGGGSNGGSGGGSNGDPSQVNDETPAGGGSGGQSQVSDESPYGGGNGGGGQSDPDPVTVVEGTDPVDGDLVIGENGTHKPGHSPGQVEVSGDYILNGILEIELAGTDPGTEYDQILVGGDAILDGTIKVFLLDDFVPDIDDVFDIIIADTIELMDGFSIELPDIPGPNFFDWMLVELDNGRMAFRLVDPPGAAIPGPAAGLVFLSGLGVLVAVRRRRARTDPAA